MDDIQRLKRISTLESRLKHLEIDERAYIIRAEHVRSSINAIKKEIEELERKMRVSFCLDQFKDGQIKGFRMIIDSGQEQFDDISIGTLAG